MEQMLLEKFKQVIATLDEQFTSHDFIKNFLKLYENEYREWFNESSLPVVHSNIGKILVNNQEKLGIEKNGRVNSETFHGTLGNVQSWKKSNNQQII